MGLPEVEISIMSKLKKSMFAERVFFLLTVLSVDIWDSIPPATTKP